MAEYEPLAPFDEAMGEEPPPPPPPPPAKSPIAPSVPLRDDDDVDLNTRSSKRTNSGRKKGKKGQDTKDKKDKKRSSGKESQLSNISTLQTTRRGDDVDGKKTKNNEGSRKTDTLTDGSGASEARTTAEEKRLKKKEWRLYLSLWILLGSFLLCFIFVLIVFLHATKVASFIPAFSEERRGLECP